MLEKFPLKKYGMVCLILGRDYGRTLTFQKTDRQINIRARFGFSISPGALSSESLIAKQLKEDYGLLQIKLQDYQYLESRALKSMDF